MIIMIMNDNDDIVSNIDDVIINNRPEGHRPMGGYI